MKIDYKREAAADRLEELAAIAKAMVGDIRTGDGPADPYSLLYWLRTEVGRVVSGMGAGLGRSTQSIKDHYEES